MLSGVLVAVLVVIWAVVLVPMWVRRHDGSAYGERRGRVLPRRTADPENERRRMVRPPVVLSPRVARRRMLRRRRATLLVLGGLLVVTAVGVLVGALPPFFVGASAVLVATYGWRLRRSVRTERRRGRAARRLARAHRTSRFRDFAVPDAPLATPSPAHASAADGAAASADDQSWTLVPLPLPSYVTAPPAPSVVDGDWHEEDLVEDELPGGGAPYGLDTPAEEPRRAVGD